MIVLHGSLKCVAKDVPVYVYKVICDSHWSMLVRQEKKGQVFKDLQTLLFDASRYDTIRRYFQQRIQRYTGMLGLTIIICSYSVIS